jgi:L-threonylcarbamoyladenylate synthase
MGAAAVVAALRAGEAVLLPTDTVYGLCAAAGDEDAVRRLSRLKGRAEETPIALLAADLETVLELVPELIGPPARAAAALLPGPFTLVLPNPSGRFPWLAGSNAASIGVRVPALAAAVAAVVGEVGAVAATSANLHGGPDPRRLADVPPALREACAAELDAGDLPGTPSTVLDLTGPEPRVLREGAVAAAEALARLTAARSS